MNRKIGLTVLLLLVGSVMGCGTASQTEDSVNMEINSGEEAVLDASLETSISQEVNNMTMTLSFDDTVLIANLVDCGTTDEFISDLPATIRMADYYSRIKYSYFDAPISQDGLKQLEYEVGDIAYWPEGNELLIYYDHDHKPMRSDIIVIGRVESGIEKLAEYSGSVEITFALEQN